MAQPAPRSTVRREMRGVSFLVDFGISITFWIPLRPFRAKLGTRAVQKLRAGDDGLYQRIKPILFRREPGLHAAR